MINKNLLLERFIRYVKIYTTSDPNSSSCPSTKRQLDMLNVLYSELKEFGLEAKIDENGYVYAKIPSNSNKKIPKVAFIAHVDTAPDLSGENVKPQIIENYDGKIIKLNEEYNLDPTVFPKLKNYMNKTIITTDGNTLLGSDDKAGVAEIMEMVRYFVDHKNIEHGDILVGFTPDEEIGRGADLFNVDEFGADFAYTLDGGEIGELQYENFNASSFNLKIKGRNVHPGTAKDQMISSITIGGKFDSEVNQEQRPELTENYEGFYMLTSFNGTIEETNLSYIIRDHDKTLFENKKSEIVSLVKKYEKKHPKVKFEFTLTDSYYNMKDVIEKDMKIIKYAKIAFEKSNIKPLIGPIRGGTDGARLSFMGLPCPNIFTGGHNFHGRYEYNVLESMVKASEVAINIVKVIVDEN